MCDGVSGASPSPPSWWDVSLYSFVEDMPREGWLWEFMRRDKLREILGDSPVDAMNPDPDLENIDPDYWNYYRPWNHERWANILPVFLPPAAIVQGRWPRGFDGQEFRIEDRDLRQMEEVRIDLNRKNTIIVRDLKALLEAIREETPEPIAVRMRISDWVDNNILAVWDLREFSVPWLEIAIILGLGGPYADARDAAVNSFNSAQRRIDNDGWKDLARAIEST